MEKNLKTKPQLEEMYRDLMGCKCVPVETGCVEQFVRYCYVAHGLIVNGGSITEDRNGQYVYID